MLSDGKFWMLIIQYNILFITLFKSLYIITGVLYDKYIILIHFLFKLKILFKGPLQSEVHDIHPLGSLNVYATGHYIHSLNW